MRILLVALVKDFIKAVKPGKPRGTIFFRIPSLALANIAAHTPREDEVIVIDEQISPVDYSLKVDLVAISVNTAVANRAYEIADQFRKRGVKVVFGGIQTFLQPEETQKHADSIIVGDAEGLWEEMLSDFKKNRLKKKYLNTQMTPLTNLPIPKREIFKGMGYISTNLVETSRGCIYRCSFCSTSPFYKYKHRTRPVKDVILDIKSVPSFPKKLIIFTDDNIIADKKYAKRLFKALIPLNIYWGSQATVSITDDEELVRLAAKSGCFALFLGLESVSQQNLQLIGKKQNHVDRYKKAISLLHKNGISVEGGFIFGFDHDTPEVFEKSFDFIREIKLDALLSLYLTPLPGTRLYDVFNKQKRIIENDLSHYDFRHIVFKPKNMTTRDIYNGVSWLTKSFYSRKLIFGRIAYKAFDFILHPSMRRLFGLIALIAFSIGSRKRIREYARDGTFPVSFRYI